MNQQNNKRKVSPDNIPPLGDEPDKKKTGLISIGYMVLFFSLL